MAEKKQSQIVTRFAPSPTGFFHIGGFRTALFNYLYAKRHGGKVVLRIEDTDKERSKEEYEKNILDGLNWLGLSFDETYKQSERTELYENFLKKLVDDGKAYISKEEATEGKRGEVIRFKNPNTKITFFDLIRGDTTFDTTDLGDFVIAKSLTEPLYHLAVVVDDHLMGITHVIRGEEHISNTPRQILIGEAIGAQRPIYAHVPLILAPDRSKLSKRKGARALTDYREMGYLPEALVNYMALLGWNPGDDREFFTLDELTKVFDIGKVQKAGAMYNEEKLRWLNKEYLKKKSPFRVIEAIKPFFKQSQKFTKNKWKISDDLLQKIYPIILDRISVYGDIVNMLEAGEFDYFFEEPDFKPEELIWKDETGPENTKSYISDSISILEKADNDQFNNPESVKNLLWEYATIKGRGNVLWPLRFALTGKIKSPDPFTIMSVLGKKESLKRLEKAEKLLK